MDKIETNATKNSCSEVVSFVIAWQKFECWVYVVNPSGDFTVMNDLQVEVRFVVTENCRKWQLNDSWHFVSVPICPNHWLPIQTIKVVQRVPNQFLILFPNLHSFIEQQLIISLWLLFNFRNVHMCMPIAGSNSFAQPYRCWHFKSWTCATVEVKCSKKEQKRCKC